MVAWLDRSEYGIPSTVMSIFLQESLDHPDILIAFTKAHGERMGKHLDNTVIDIIRYWNFFSDILPFFIVSIAVMPVMFLCQSLSKRNIAFDSDILFLMDFKKKSWIST